MSDAQKKSFDELIEEPVEDIEVEEEGVAVEEAPFMGPMPEAVSVVFTELLTQNGDRIHITCRGMSGRQALDELAATVNYAREEYNFRLPNASRGEVAAMASTPSEPRYVPDELTTAPQITGPTGVSLPPSQTTITDIPVKSIARERKRDGTGDFLRVRGGYYVKHGAPAYDNVFPQGFNIDAMQYGLEYPPPQGMTTARVQAQVDVSGKASKAKVVQFL